MANLRRPSIRVYPASPGSHRYVAVFPSEVLGATFAVVFRESVTGAVALHTFAEMIRKQYEHPVEIIVSDRVSLPLDSPVRDILAQVHKPLFVHDNR